MRRSLTMAVALAATAATPAAAAARADEDARFDGTYCSAEQGTYWSDNRLPAGFSLTIDLRFAGGRLTYRSVNDTDKARPTTLDYVAPVDGSAVAIAGQARYDHVSVRRLARGEFQLLKLKGDDVIVGEFWRFEPSGATLVRRGVGKSPEGVSRAFQETFHRCRRPMDGAP